MDAIAPLSVLLVGLFGVLVVVVGLTRVVWAERRLLAEVVPVVNLVPPPAAPLAGDGIAA